ncbi:MAG: hypothetical protein AAGB19_00590 [Cyanobacteria bacterium P01_F01_bin.3]
MTSFDFNNISTLYSKPEALSMQDLNGLLRVHLKQIPQKAALELPRICFTEIDQAFLIWGWMTMAIFSLAQFSTLSWTTQALIDSAITGISVATTAGLTWKLASEERLRWVVFLWSGLMMTGMLATSYGIFHGVIVILANLCLLWLSLCVVGYGAMGIWMRSRAFSASCIVHILAIIGLHYYPSFQFVGSGLVMAATLFFFSFVPWDMGTSDSDIPC